MTKLRAIAHAMGRSIAPAENVVREEIAVA
jgi:hypothetical protein